MRKLAMDAYNIQSNPTVKLIDPENGPRLSVTVEALAKMKAYTMICNDEISWMGHITQDEGAFLLDDVFLISQESAMATVEITQKGLADFTVKMIQEKGIEYYNEIRLWGHSHVNMGTAPSGQDLKQIREWKDQNYHIMLITNKRGDAHVEFYDFKNNLVYTNIPIKIDLPDSNNIFIEACKDVEKYVSKQKRVTINPNFYSQIPLRLTNVPSGTVYNNDMIGNATDGFNDPLVDEELYDLDEDARDTFTGYIEEILGMEEEIADMGFENNILDILGQVDSFTTVQSYLDAIPDRDVLESYVRDLKHILPYCADWRQVIVDCLKNYTEEGEEENNVKPS